MNVRITGTGSALPGKILTNAELEKLVDTSDEWITTRTGIKERRIAAEGEYTSTFAAEAGRRALAMAGVQPDEIDLIILSTVTPDFPFPSTACIVQDLLGATNATAFDLSAACSGFILVYQSPKNIFDLVLRERSLLLDLKCYHESSTGRIAIPAFCSATERVQ